MNNMAIGSVASEIEDLLFLLPSRKPECATQATSVLQTRCHQAKGPLDDSGNKICYFGPGMSMAFIIETQGGKLMMGKKYV